MLLTLQLLNWGVIGTRDALVARHEQLGAPPVDWLSDGIRNMIGMVADIAFRATKFNGHLGAQAAQETPGLMLIDEVDMHLHPEWQQVVLLNPAQAFPAMQLIVTTHSPQVLSTVSSACVRILRSEIDPETTSRVTTVIELQWQTRGVASSDLFPRSRGRRCLIPYKRTRRLHSRMTGCSAPKCASSLSLNTRPSGCS